MSENNKSKKKRKIFIIIAVLLLLTAVFLRESIATAFTVREMNNNSNLFFAENKLDYDCGSILRANITSTRELIAYVGNRISGGLIPSFVIKSIVNKIDSFACTSFSCKTQDGDVVLARNFDYGVDGAIVVYSNPKNGYRSFSTCTPELLGLTPEIIKKFRLSRLLLSGLVFIPVDGINEKGLAISVNECGRNPANQSTGKNAVTTSLLIRLVLDKCSTVDEAIELLESVDIHDELKDMLDSSLPGASYHYIIADSSGNSVVIEFDYAENSKTVVIKRDEKKNYQIITNHYIMDSHINELSEKLESGKRMQTACALLSNSVRNPEKCLEILECCKIDPPLKCEEYKDYYFGTKWSVVYNLTDKSVLIKLNNENNTYRFDFPEVL